MSPSLFDTDPLILTRIAGHVGQRRSDLCSLLRVCKVFNTTVTPTLYSDIELDESTSMLKCIKILAASPGSRVFGRDLPALVHSFVLRVPTDDLHWEADPHVFGTSLLTCLLRMVNLRKFSSPLPLPSAPTYLSLILSGSRPQLKSIRLVVPKSQEAQRSRIPPTTDSAKLPELHTFKLDVWHPFEPALARSIQNLLRLRADTLRSLSLTTSLAEEGLDIVRPLLPSDVEFTALEELEIEVSALSHPSLRHTATIKSLCIPDSLDDEVPGVHTLLRRAFPALESLACPNSIVSEFFPAEVGRRRPIRTLRLNGASYGLRSLDWTGDESEWFDLQDILPLLRYSAVPVRDLSFAVMDLPLEDLPEVVPYLTTLHRLVVVFSDDIEDAEDYLSELGRVLLAHLPHLHTFLLSDMPIQVQNEGNGFKHAQNLALQRRVLAKYEKNSPALQRVAFTSEFGWEKRGDQWYPEAASSFI